MLNRVGRFESVFRVGFPSRFAELARPSPQDAPPAVPWHATDSENDKEYDSENDSENDSKNDSESDPAAAAVSEPPKTDKKQTKIRTTACGPGLARGCEVAAGDAVGDIGAAVGDIGAAIGDIGAAIGDNRR